MTEPTPLPPLPNSSSNGKIITSSLDVAFNAMLLDPPLMSPNDYANNWGTADTEDAVAFSGKKKSHNCQHQAPGGGRAAAAVAGSAAAAAA